MASHNWRAGHVSTQLLEGLRVTKMLARGITHTPLSASAVLDFQAWKWPYAPGPCPPSKSRAGNVSTQLPEGLRVTKMLARGITHTPFARNQPWTVFAIPGPVGNVRYYHEEDSAPGERIGTLLDAMWHKIECPLFAKQSIKKVWLHWPDSSINS